MITSPLSKALHRFTAVYCVSDTFMSVPPAHNCCSSNQSLLFRAIVIFHILSRHAPFIWVIFVLFELHISLNIDWRKTLEVMLGVSPKRQ
jgi:hypothetical protein